MTVLTKPVTLNPGESAPVSFETVPHEAKAYHVSVNGLTGSFVAVAPPGLIGDLNDDGILSSVDLDILKKYIVGYPISQISPLTETEFLRRADVNGDGVINNLDITALETLVPPPVIDYSGKRVWCAYRIYHELPGREATTWVVTETAGRIGNLSVSLTKAGLAGVEATFKILTGGEGHLEFVTLEVLGWWQWGKYRTGVGIWDYNYMPSPWRGSKYVDIGAGEMLHYRVYVVPEGVLIKIWNAGDELIFEYLYECDAKRIITFQTELEYWRYIYHSTGEPGGEWLPVEGSFYFSGEVILEKLYREGVGWLNPADVLSFPEPAIDVVVGVADPRILMSYDHYKQGGYIIFKGEVIDVV